MREQLEPCKSYKYVSVCVCGGGGGGGGGGFRGKRGYRIEENYGHQVYIKVITVVD